MNKKIISLLLCIVLVACSGSYLAFANGFETDEIPLFPGSTTTTKPTTTAHSHSWGNAVVVKRATTSASGTLRYTCKCGATKISTIRKIASVKLSATSFVYNGKAKSPTVTVKNSAGKTISSAYYTVTKSSGRTNVGKYSYKITFKNRYSGSKTLYFTVKPQSTSITSLTKGSKRFTVKWSKKTNQVTGYQIQYSTGSKFTNPTTKTVTSNKTTSKTITGLKSNKKYYVRVRTYKTVNSTKYYSAWSSYKYVTTK